MRIPAAAAVFVMFLVACEVDMSGLGVAHSAETGSVDDGGAAAAEGPASSDAGTGA
jgi:hypothetical protein